ncbi:TRAP transporter substrate-binding protein [Peribacillus cavernae]|uniref:TRAP transporter substrate-binding protein n=1 Tax=Peribacillus cavernae TaxID=1674310 RepID=UPI001FE959AA|nr:TRAP transporter substrate-binding protein [Peribacillus cavernae]MDQ0218689.1 tripartite ATP-independent transporter DctP family solute receptor [Peribacillus cavernae]
MKKILLTLLVSIVLIGVTACSGSKNTAAPSDSKATASSGDSKGAKVIKLGSVNNDKHTLHDGYEKFKEIVEKETDGKVKVEIYANGLLGNDRTMIEGLELGTIEAVGVSTSMLANWAPSMLAYDLPFSISSEEVADKILDGPYGQKSAEQLEKEGILLLGYMENGFRHLTNSKREIESLDDLKGLKIRTMQTPLILETWKELGTNPTPMAYTELFTAMEQKVIDGQENPYGNMALDKFYEVQKYLTKTNHSYNPMGLVVSKKFYDKLSKDEQSILKEAGLEASAYQRKLNREKSEEYLKILEDNGMVATDLSEKERKKFEDKVQNVYKGFSDEIGQEYLDQYLAELKKYEK